MIDDFESLKRKVEKLRQEYDRAVGARDQLMKRLKSEHGCETLEEAQKQLLRLQARERTMAVRYTKKKRAFEKKWKPMLEKFDG